MILTHQMWLIDVGRPWRAARQVECRIVVGKTIVCWPNSAINHRAYYYGTSAFGTEMLANAARRNRMRDLSRPHTWFSQNRPQSFAMCQETLNKETR
jgi:hypothetical protein